MKLMGTTVILLLLIVTTGFSQRSYFEYNNPEAIKVNKKVVDHLTAFEWQIIDVRWLIRKDTFDFHGRGGTIKLERNGAYSGGSSTGTWGSSTGTWELKYNRYLILKDTNQLQYRRLISGTFAITSHTDSTLVLTQLHTSSRDMSRTITLVNDNRIPPGRKDFATNGTYRPHPTSVFPYSKPRRPTVPAFADSLTFLSKDVLTLLGYREGNDTLFIIRSDTVFKIRLDNNPLKKVAIFDESKKVEDYEAYNRFTLPAEQIPIVDSLAMNYIRAHRDDYYPQKEITSLAPYFRQYVGYFDIDGDAIVLLNASCQYKSSWRDSFLQPRLGGTCYFNISINLTKKEAFSFHVNDF